jgi:hypothetical protein
MAAKQAPQSRASGPRATQNDNKGPIEIQQLLRTGTIVLDRYLLGIRSQSLNVPLTTEERRATWDYIIAEKVVPTNPVSKP